VKDDDEFTTAGVGAPDVEDLLRRIAELVGNARPMPLSASVMINRDEVLELVDEAADRLPEELRQARWLLRERDEFLATVQRQGDDILDQARVQAERMVQRTEVVRAGPAHRPPHGGGGGGRRPAPPPRGRGLLRPEAGAVRGGARPHDADGAGGPRELQGTADIGVPPRPRRRTTDGVADAEFFDQDS
jgi:hypothetical protein